MGLIDDLNAFGADTELAIDRLRGNINLYTQLVLDCLEDIEENPVLEYIEANDYETACMNAHTMKGIMGNLGINPLYELYFEVNDLLKNKDYEAAKAKVQAGMDIQQNFIELLQKYA